MSVNELEFVEWLREQARIGDTGGVISDGTRRLVGLGIGDDMAIVDSPSGRWLMSSDMLLDGVHFDTSRHSLSQIGRKAIACALSDCAAMAVCPMAATVSVALPAGHQLADAQELYGGMSAVATEYGLAVVGGDTTCWDHPLAIDVAITGRPYDGVEPVTRSGAKAGDALYVTGPLGGSLLGRHFSFTPRILEAKALAEQLGDRLHAMIDISDGLALDLWRICQASNVGATLDEDQLEPAISEDAGRAAAADGRRLLDHVLGDGEDFELLLAVDGDIASPAATLYRVGEVTASGLALRTTDGRVNPLEPKGYIH